jgi:hypothetical protein
MNRIVGVVLCLVGMALVFAGWTGAWLFLAGLLVGAGTIAFFYAGEDC